MCAPQLTPQLTNEQIDQISATLGQAAQAIKKLNYGQILNQDDVYALSQAYGCLKATLDWFYQYDREPNTFPEMQSFAWGDSICPALAVIANLLNHLAGGAPLIVLASYVQLPKAAKDLDEIISHVADELDEHNENAANLKLARDQFRHYDRALTNVTELFNVAYDYITLTAHYGYNASIAPIPAGPIKRTALQIADLYLRDKLPQSKSINLCAYVLLALAGLTENDDWRNASKQTLKMDDIDQWPQQQRFAMQIQWDKQQIRTNALNALLAANIIQRNGYKYNIVPAHLAALKQLAAMLDRA